MKTFLPVLAAILVLGTFFISSKINFEEIKTKEIVNNSEKIETKKTKQIPDISVKIDTPKIVKTQKEDTSKGFVSEGHFVRNAQFNGGSEAMKGFIAKNLKFPKSYMCGEGTVYVRLMIDVDGSIIKDCVKIAKSFERSFDEEAIRVIKLMPNWTPAMWYHNGKKVQQRIRVPVKFRIGK